MTKKQSQLIEIEAHKFISEDEARVVNAAFSDNALRMMKRLLELP